MVAKCEVASLLAGRIAVGLGSVELGLTCGMVVVPCSFLNGMTCISECCVPLGACGEGQRGGGGQSCWLEAIVYCTCWC